MSKLEIPPGIREEHKDAITCHERNLGSVTGSNRLAKVAESTGSICDGWQLLEQRHPVMKS